MLRKFVSVLIALSVAFSPTLASSQEYIFRYKTAAFSPPVDEPSPEYGVGNDIRAYFVSPVGLPFSREIPVTTRDVVSWQHQDGAMPSGIAVNRTNGIVSGTPDSAEQTVSTYIGYDGQGGRIARAQIFFSVFQPQGVGQEVDLYSHTNQYFYEQLPAASAEPVVRWEPFPGTSVPPGVQTRNGALDGTPTAAGTYAVGWQGYDYLDRPVAYVYGSFVVEDGPTLEEIPDQVVDKNIGEQFNVSPVVRNKIGTLTYKLIPENGRPDGITFSSATGQIGSVFDEFETSADFRIEARDSYDGTTGVSNVFTLQTLPEDLSLVPTKDLYGVVGINFSRAFKYGSTSENVRWDVTQGSLPDGVTLDAETGLISGVPTKSGEFKKIVITASGTGVVTRSSDPFTFTVAGAELILEPYTKYVRTNEAFSTALPKVVQAREAITYTLNATTPVDASTTFSDGIFSSSAGYASAGNHTWLVDAKAGLSKATIRQNVVVLDPLEPTYQNTKIKQNQNADLRVTIDYDMIVGTPTFSVSNPGGLPSWLTISQKTGRITGIPDIKVPAGVYGPFEVTVTDALGKPFKSNAFTVEIEGREKIAGTLGLQEAQRFVNNSGTILTVEHNNGDVTYELMERGTLPSRLYIGNVFNRAILFGRTTDEVGTIYTGVRIKAIDKDGEAFSWTSDPFNIEVVEPADPKPIDGSLNVPFTWSTNRPLRDLALPIMTGTYGTVTYTLDANPFGLILTDGTISPDTRMRKLVTGQFPQPGTYSVGYSIEDELDRPEVRGTLEITVLPPVELESDALMFNRGTYGEQGPTTEYGIPKLKYWMSPSSAILPKGLVFDSKTGMITGTAEEEVKFPISIHVQDRTEETDDTGLIDLIVDEPLPFSFSYPTPIVVEGKRATIYPTINNALKKVEWTVDQDAIPPGMRFEPTNGGFIGYPSTPGIYTIKVSGFDSETNFPQTGSYEATIKVAPKDPIDFTPVTFKTRSGASHTFKLEPGKVIAPLDFTFTTGANQLSQFILLDSETGEISANFPDVGAFSTRVQVDDAVERSASATVTFDVVGDLQLSAPSSIVFKQFVSEPASLTVSNAVGTITYGLSDDSPELPNGLWINSSSGQIEGAAEVAMSPTTYRIVATDAFDGSSATSDPVVIEVKAREQMVATMSSISAKQFAEINQAVELENAIAPVSTWSIVPSLPEGLYFDAGVVHGSLNDTFTGTFTVTVVDAKGGTLGTDTTEPFQINVSPRDQLTFVPMGSSNISAKQHADIGNISPATVINAVGEITWSIDPSLPEGLVFSHGVISGAAQNATETATYVIRATDGKGGDLGNAEYAITLTVEERDELKLIAPDTHTFNQYFEGTFELDEENAIDGATFSVTPMLPAGFTLDVESGTVTATPSEKFVATPYTFRVTDGVEDYKDKVVMLNVGDRLKPEITRDNSSPIQALIGYSATTTLGTNNVLGEAAWRLVSGNLPAGTTFDEVTGTIRGIPTEFGLFPGIAVQLIDTFNGISTESAIKTFAIDVAQDGTPITVSAKNKEMRVGHRLTTEKPVVSNAVGDLTWTAVGLDDTGLAIDPRTGVITGTINSTSTINAILTVEDVTGRSAEASIEIKIVPELILSMTDDNEVLFNYTLEDAGVDQPTVDNAHGKLTWNLIGENSLPEGLTFDAQAGMFVGRPKEIGVFGPISLTVGDELPGTKTVNQIWFTVYMNDDPIELEVTGIRTKVGRQISTALPVFDNVLGTPRFYSLDLAGTNLKIDPHTGVMTGIFSEVIDRTFNVSITDDTLRVTSKPLRIEVLPQMILTAPDQITIAAQEPMSPVIVSATNSIGAISWEPVDTSLLPAGVTFNTTLGRFEGIAEPLGTFGPVTAAGTDSLGDRAVSNPIIIRSQAGAYYLSLATAPMPDAVKRIEEYEFDFKTLTTLVGMDQSELTWSWTPTNPNGTLPEGLVLDTATGVLKGVPQRSGLYTFDVTASGLANRTSTARYSLAINLPEIKLELAETNPDNATVDVAYIYDFKPTLTLENIEEEDVRFAMVADPLLDQRLPSGMSLNPTTGVLSGYPLASGVYEFTVTASFNHNEESISDTQTLKLTIKGTEYVKYDGANSPSCALTIQGGVKCWGGNNIYGQIGDGTTSTKLNPVNVKNLTENIIDIAVGENNACALSKDGKIYCWGRNLNNVIGTGTSNYSSPRHLFTVSGASKIAMGASFGCVMTNSGNVSCWGSNSNGQFGNGTETSSATLVAMNIGNGIPVDISAQDNATCIQFSDGIIKCTGSGYGATLTPVSGANDAVKMAAGQTHVCYVNTSASVKCFGTNALGQLGNGTTTASASAITVPGLSSIKDISSGNHFSCALRTDGTPICWGYNHVGQIGTGSVSSSVPTPTIVSGNINKIASLHSGRFNTMAIDEDGQAWTWGYSFGTIAAPY